VPHFLLNSGYASNRRFDAVFNNTVNTLLDNNRTASISHTSPSTTTQAMMPVPQESLLTKPPTAAGKRKRDETNTGTDIDSQRNPREYFLFVKCCPPRTIFFIKTNKYCHCQFSF